MRAFVSGLSPGLPWCSAARAQHVPTKYDPKVYIMHLDGEMLSQIATHLDDLLGASKDDVRERTIKTRVPRGRPERRAA